jgi:hypothetical protein
MGEICSSYEHDTPFEQKIVFPSLEPLPTLAEQALNTLQNLPPFYNTTAERGKDEIQVRFGTLKGIYKGQGEGKVPHGNGAIYFDSGAFLEGIFQAGQCRGPARLIFSNGDYFTGVIEDMEAKEGEFHDIKTGTTLRGKFKGNRLDGEGEEINPTLGAYKGWFKNGAKEGFGVYKFKSGDSYKGNFKNDEF